VGKADKYEMIKVVCQAVIATRDGDRIIAEDVSPQTPCYSKEACQKFYIDAAEEVKQLNLQDRATTKKK